MPHKIVVNTPKFGKKKKSHFHLVSYQHQKPYTIKHIQKF